MSNKMNGVEEWVRSPPPTGSVWERIGKVIYNPQEKSVLGRTPKRWAILFAFYLVFYSVLAMMFAACMSGLLLTLNETRPTYVLSKSLIGSNPGVSHRPLGIPIESVVRYNADNASHFDQYVEQLNVFFAAYRNEVWYTEQSECVAADSYGYPNTPCFFIKVNKIIDWKPDLYNVASLPQDMPGDLTEHIQSQDPDKQNQIWVSCAEETSNDTKIDYPWGQGLPADFYPYLNREDYRSPVVAVRIVPTANKLITIRCRAWAKNILYNKSIKEPSGYTFLQLYIDDDTAGNTTLGDKAVSYVTGVKLKREHNEGFLTPELSEGQPRIDDFFETGQKLDS